MPIVQGSMWETHRVRVPGGFPFAYAWVNSAGMIEGQLNKIAEINKRGSDCTTQPCGIFAKSAWLTGKLRWQVKPLDFIKGVDRLEWYHKLKLRVPEWKPLEISVAMMSSIHMSNDLDSGTLDHLKFLSGKVHEPNLYSNSSASPLYGFMLREGAEYNGAMLAGRKVAAAEVYRDANHKTASKLHNDVNDTDNAKKIIYYCEAYFNYIADRSLDEILDLWNPKCKIKNSSPSWSANILKNSLSFMPKNTDELMNVWLEDKNAYDVKKFSWKWWNAFLENEYIRRDCRDRIWTNIQNWYTQMGNSFAVMAELILEAMMKRYDKYSDCTHLVIDPSPEMGFSTYGRDSCNVTSSTINDGRWTVTIDDDKQRDVSRALTAPLSIIETFELTDVMNRHCEGKLVIDGPSWMNNFYCVAGCDRKNADQVAGIVMNLPSYGRVNKHIIDALAEASGELYTPFGNEATEYDEDKYLGLVKHVRTYTGDDIGLNLWDYQTYLDLHDQEFPWTFPAYTAKQTLDYTSKWDEYKYRVVFNLGRGRFMNNDHDFLFALRSPKIIKTEQTPLGALKTRNESWNLPEYGKASFSEIAAWEKPLWYCDSEQEYEEFLPQLTYAVKHDMVRDVPESVLVYVI